MSVDPLANVVSALERAKIIPDVIPSTSSFSSPCGPTLLFSIIYPSGGGKEVLLGNEFTVEETQEEPVVSFTPMTIPVEQAENQDLKEVGYTLCMLDPDVPTEENPEFRSFRHWVVTGSKSPADTASATSSAAALKTQAAVTPYRPPGPRPNSGTHRYTFLLFQEPSASPIKIEDDAPEHGSALEQRRHWEPFRFAEKYGLKLVGANFLTLKSAPQ